MNPQETKELMDMIRWIRKEFGLTILLIEHDMSLVMGICERIYVLEYGEIIAQARRMRSSRTRRSSGPTSAANEQGQKYGRCTESRDVYAEPMLKIDNIDVYYGAIHALKGISLEVKEARSSP